MQSSDELPWLAVLLMYCHTSVLGEQPLSDPRRGTKEALPMALLLDSVLCAFPLVDFNLYPFPMSECMKSLTSV